LITSHHTTMPTLKGIICFNKKLNYWCCYCCCYLIKLEKSVLKRLILTIKSQFWPPEKYFNIEMIVLTLVN
jgi:hypothetical protein